MPVIETEAETEAEVVETQRGEAPRDQAPRDQAPRQEDRRSEDRRPARNGSDRRPVEGRPSENRSSDNRYLPRSGSDRDRVVGMGDHVPDFILRSFRIDTLPTEEAEEDQAT